MNIKESTYIYRKEHSKKTYDQILILYRKEERAKERIAIAAKKKGLTSQKYIRQAINSALQLDGITVDSLPSPDRAEAEPVKHD